MFSAIFMKKTESKVGVAAQRMGIVEKSWNQRALIIVMMTNFSSVGFM
jgi:hypothetical protein